ncbi:MAG: lyase family protein [archaeon]
MSLGRRSRISKNMISKFGLYSPTDYRYSVEALAQYLSVEAFVKYKASVEGGLARTLAQYHVCSKEIADEIALAAQKTSATEVFEEEQRVRHDIRALVNVIRAKVSNEAKPYVHLAATSYDINDTANALRYRDAIKSVILHDMAALEKEWIELARRERDTIQIGRTHGQFASPVTFGFVIAQYVERLGERIIRLMEATDRLAGKFAGSVGAYNASALFIADPEKFEKDMLSSLGLRPARISTQVVPAEPLTDLIHSVISAWGVLANFCRDMRHLQRSEIGEVGERFSAEQVGSSTMPQKRNPESFENIESLWKEFAPRMITKYLDQVSEHQRDLTNSASQRYDAEFLTVFDYCVRRLTRVCHTLVVDKENIQRNFDSGRDSVASEPMYILLAQAGHPDAHEYIRKLNLASMQDRRTVTDLFFSDRSLEPFLKKLSKENLDAIRDPSNYIGVAPLKVDRVTDYWENKLKEEHLQ